MIWECLSSKKSISTNWLNLGPEVVPPKIDSQKKSGAGRINCIAFHPTNPMIMWAGAPSGGFWKTLNGGSSWFTTTDDLISIGVSDIAVNPANPNELFIVTGDGDAGDTYSIGILKSIDGGMSWLPTSLSRETSDREYFRRIIVSPVQPGLMIASSNKGIYKTSDGFESFIKVEEGHFKDLEFHPANPSIVYATSYDPQGNAAFFRSTDSGTTFFEVRTGMAIYGKVNRIEIAVTPAVPSYVYALTSSADDDGFYALFRSRNSGQSWSKVYDTSDKNLLGWETNGQDKGGQGWYDLSLAVSPLDEAMLLTGGVNIWKSTNEGQNFALAAHWKGYKNIDYVHADHHSLVYHPLTHNLFSCNDGGIYKSTNDGESWTDISDGLEILQIYRIAASPTVFDLFLTGNQDNGSMRRSAGDWAEITGGDGMECIIDHENPDILYTSFYYGSFSKSTDAGLNFFPIGPEDVKGSGAWITPFIMDAVNPEVLYTGYKDVYKSLDGGISWYKISDNLTRGANLRFLAVAPSNPDYIYASTYSDIWLSKNGGGNWVNISAGLPDNAITSIEIAPNNPEYLWITMSGYSIGEKIYYSTSGGSNWVNYSEGLPNVPANIIIRRKSSKDELYLGTDLGVFYRDAEMAEWVWINGNLPNVIINDLKMQENYNRLVAGTYGRGLWYSSLNETISLYAEIYPAFPQSCLNEEAIFQVQTIPAPDSIVWNLNGERVISSGISPMVAYTFETPGIKNISATVYKSGLSYTSHLDNYFSVITQPQIKIAVHDTSNLHPGQIYLSASGANTYFWEPTGLFSNPFTPYVTPYLTTSTSIKVTGTVGNCIASDSIMLTVFPGPVNDNICGALELSDGLNGPFNNAFATVQINEPLPDTSNCNTQYSWCNEGGLQHTLWFSYVPKSSKVSFRTSGFDTQIAIYSADTCNSLLEGNYTLIAANDDYFGSGENYASALNLVPLNPGKKYWIQVDGSGGGETGEFTLDINDFPVSVEEDELRNEPARLYPNPSNGLFNLNLADISGNVKVEIIQLTGKIVFSRIFPSTGNRNIQIRLEEKGFYLVRIQNDHIFLTERIVIE